MRALLCLLTTVGFLAPAVGEAAPPTPAPAATAESALLDRIQAKYAPVTVLRAKFVQKVGSALYGEERQEGTLVLERPGKMRWEFGDGREFVCDGQTMWIYNPTDKQVLKLRDVGEQAASANAVLSSMHRLKELFDVTVVASDPTSGHTLSLTAKEGQEQQFKKLHLKLDRELRMAEVRLTDAFDAVTTLTFTDVALGGTVAPDVFTFVVPDGVEVIDSGG
jgi:outer membrane lipoprotein carrier protein